MTDGSFLLVNSKFPCIERSKDRPGSVQHSARERVVVILLDWIGRHDEHLVGISTTTSYLSFLNRIALPYPESQHRHASSTLVSLAFDRKLIVKISRYVVLLDRI